MLFRKGIRTMAQYRAQFLSMVVMIALGIGVFVGFHMEWYSLERDVFAFFDKTGFADFRILSESGFDAAQRDEIAAIGGVTRASRYLAVNTTEEGSGDVVALTVTEDARVSGVIVTAGDAYDAASEDGLWLSDRYAAANGVAVGDTMRLVYKNLVIEGTVRGLVNSGEYLICLPDETQLMPDYSTYGYAYAAPALVRRVLGGEFYTEIHALSALSKKEFTAAAERALGRTVLVLAKDDTLSYGEAMGESREGKTMAAVLPVLFLAIAVLTMVTTMHRLTASEKTQIGTLKSLGFKDRRILAHYSAYALGIGLVGTALGAALGWWLGWFIMNPDGSMGTYLDMDDWSLAVPPFVWAVLAGINLFFVLIGFLSVKSMLRGTAADALRPYTPKKMRRLWLERFPFWARLRFGTQWNLRDCLRHKARSAMTLFGIVGCMVLLVGGLGMKDTADRFVDLFYNRAIRYANRIFLASDGVGREEAEAIASAYEGDWCAQSSVQVEDSPVGLEIYRIRQDLVRFVDDGGNFLTLGDDGAYLCERVADAHSLRVGDTLTFSPYGDEESYTVRVAGIVRSMTKSIVMTDAYADRVGIPYRITSVLTARESVAPDERIVSVQSKQSIVDSFDTFMEIMFTMILLLVFAAVVLGVVVLYNLGVMSYIERSREMATLKVLGFRDRRIGWLLIGQNLWMTVLGVLIGIPCGVGVLWYLLRALASEYEMRLAIGPTTYAVSILLTFGVSLLVGAMVARKNRRIDMVAALKAQE